MYINWNVFILGKPMSQFLPGPLNSTLRDNILVYQRFITTDLIFIKPPLHIEKPLTPLTIQDFFFLFYFWVSSRR